jgi:hypothetical protein
MDSTNESKHAPAELPDQARLLELELRIARRADELANVGLPVRDRNLECWIQAEREVLAK